jgi:hypothetical protein
MKAVETMSKDNKNLVLSRMPRIHPLCGAVIFFVE